MRSSIQEASLKARCKELFKAAEAARKKAYCPYSGFSVGAAVLTSNNKVYTGANVENVSYGLTCCAERIAVFNAVADGERELTAVAVAGPGDEPLEPCGACRQVIYEFGKNAFVLSSSNKKIKIAKISKLLPEAFDRQALMKKRR